MGPSDIPPLLQAAEAVLRAIGLFIVVPLLAYRLIRTPPPWTNRLFVRRVKVPGAELEIERQETTVAIVPDASQTSAIAPPSEEELPSSGVIPPATGTRFELAAGHLERGDYQKGMEIVRQMAAEEQDPSEAASLIAWGQIVAYRNGVNAARADLEATARSHPRNSEVQSFYALSFNVAGQTTRAIEQMRIALACATTDADRVSAARLLATTLREEKRFDEARDMLNEQLALVSEAQSRSRLYLAFSGIFEDEGKKHYAMLMLELALKFSPADAEVRFDTAYKYADLDNPAMALYHYEQLLERSPSHAHALNNIGLVAIKLGMPMVGIQYQRRSEAEGSTLAMANIASALMTAGFRDEAKALIAKAREHENPDRRVEIVSGSIASSEATEEKLLRTVGENIAKLRRWRLREAEAVLATPIPAETIAGKYVGFPAELTLRTDGPDRLIGEFQRGASRADFLGTLNGRVLSFSWRAQPVKSDVSYYRSPNEKSGWGVLIVSDMRLEGFYTEKSDAPSGKELPGWAEWELNLVTNETQQPAPEKE